MKTEVRLGLREIRRLALWGMYAGTVKPRWTPADQKLYSTLAEWQLALEDEQKKRKKGGKHDS